MTTITVHGKKVVLTVEQKARLLQVFELDGEEGVLAVTSGSKANTAYVVQHNGYCVTHCPCQSYGRCAHTLAANWYLEAKRRECYHVTFNPCNVA